MKPDTPTVELYSSVGGALIFKELLAEWCRAGWKSAGRHELTEREYRVSGWWSRLRVIGRMYVVYPARCHWNAGQSAGSPRLRVVTTNPFFLPGLVRWASDRKGGTVMLLYDLFPDVLVLAGKIRARGFLDRMLAKITSYAIRESAATVYLGEHLRRYAEGKYGLAKLGVVIPVGAAGDLFADFPPQSRAPGSAVTILYAGSMGHMHEVETLRQLWRSGSVQGIRWLFHGSGSGYRQLQGSVSRDDIPTNGSISFAGPLADKEWVDALKNNPIALVTLRAGAENLVMPSKTYSALVAGQAILAICVRKSDLAELIERHDCGWVVEPGDLAGLRSLLAAIVCAPEEVQRKRQNAFLAGHEFYSTKVVARHWSQLFASIAKTPAAD